MYKPIDVYKGYKGTYSYIQQKKMKIIKGCKIILHLNWNCLVFCSLFFGAKRFEFYRWVVKILNPKTELTQPIEKQ
jgi:hypothetical protein